MAVITPDAIRGPLEAIASAYDSLSEMDYARAALGDVAARWRSVRGAMRALALARVRQGPGADTVTAMRRRAERYLQSYDFGHELETMSLLYSEDAQRVRAMGLAIAASLSDKKLIEAVRDALDG